MEQDMVYLSKIYTRTGDDGETGIGDGSRVSKRDARIIAGGSVDEANSLLGVVRAQGTDAAMDELLALLQQWLFDLGADISCPWQPGAKEDRCPRIAQCHVDRLEQEIDKVTEHLAPLTSFILPGGSPVAAHLHVVRCVTRRAEIDVLTLQNQASINPMIAIFLNRLSDLMFVLARQANDQGRSDVLWVPGSLSNR